MEKLRVRNTGKRPLLQPYSLTISSGTVFPPGFSAALGGTVQFVISCRISIRGLTPARARGKLKGNISSRRGGGRADKACERLKWSLRSSSPPPRPLTPLNPRRPQPETKPNSGKSAVNCAPPPLGSFGSLWPRRRSHCGDRFPLVALNSDKSAPSDTERKERKEGRKRP